MGVDPAFALGAMGENLRLSGVKLAEIPEGSILELSPARGCSSPAATTPASTRRESYRRLTAPAVGQYFVKQAFGRRGILGTVLETGVVRPGDKVTILLPETVTTT